MQPRGFVCFHEICLVLLKLSKTGNVETKKKLEMEIECENLENGRTLARAILHEGWCVIVGLACQLKFSISILRLYLS